MARVGTRLLGATRTPEARRLLRDDTLKRFGVILQPSGVHSFVLSFRNTKSHERNITIAKVGAIAPDMARCKAATLWTRSRMRATG